MREIRGRAPLGFGLLACLALAAPPSSGEEEAVSFRLESAAFRAGGEIPQRFTCEGEDVSPPLRWTAPPEGARSLVLVVDDPDAPDPRAPKVVWVHWLVAGLPAEAGSLPEGASESALAGGAASGLNGWRRSGYGGPCPPIGRHRYFFRLHALDAELALPRHFSRDELDRAMKGHVLATAELVGTYQKTGR